MQIYYQPNTVRNRSSTKSGLTLVIKKNIASAPESLTKLSKPPAQISKCVYGNGASKPK